MTRVQRIIVHDHNEAYVGELDPSQLIDATSKAEVNGEHSLTVTTLQQLEKTDRLLLRDGTGRWHEYVVLGIEERRTDGGAVAHEYYCVWSLQYDLSGTFVNNLYGCGYNPGRPSTPQPARRALEVSLEGTSRWQIGTITQLAESSASFYRRSGWEGLQTTVEHWGGEIDATIEVSTTGVVGRYVNLLAHTGATEATRRFDYGHDVKSIKRLVSDDIWPCRIVPLGKSVETEAGGYTRRKSIDDVNDGIPWVEDPSAVPLTRVPDGNGGWEYPTLIVKNDTYEDPTELKAWALEHVSEYCRPIVSYTADVTQFERAGMSPHGVSLGDEVVVVDRDFLPGGLRIAARVVKVEENLLDPSQTKLTIGNAQETLGGQLGAVSREVSQLTEQAGNAGEFQATAGYLSALLGRLNSEANATGGYTYITEGQGIRTYDRAVTDPLVGAEATKVVEVKGGTIRIADSRTSGGDWDWKTVFTSGHIAAELVTAAQIVTGFIRSNGGTYIDLDSDTIQLGASASKHIVVDNKAIQMYDGNIVVANFSGADVQSGSQRFYGTYYSLGTRTDTKPGMYSFTVGLDNYAGEKSYFAGAMGRGLYAPAGNNTYSSSGNTPGIAIGGYNVKDEDNDCAGVQLLTRNGSPVKNYPLKLVIGGGDSDTNRRNLLEVDCYGNLGIAGQLITHAGEGQYLTNSSSGSPGTVQDPKAVAHITLPGDTGASSGGSIRNHIWLILAEVGSSCGVCLATRADRTSGWYTNTDAKSKQTIVQMHETDYLGEELYLNAWHTSSPYSGSISGSIQAFMLR